ncbi:hypothetical protein UYA_09110 [Ectopseudomonas alcaliphila JAB1]|nr:hypothetical protein UYA_09110 [Pseudomonas alcaliphila JAB1]
MPVSDLCIFDLLQLLSLQPQGQDDTSKGQKPQQRPDDASKIATEFNQTLMIQSHHMTWQKKVGEGCPGNYQ